MLKEGKETPPPPAEMVNLVSAGFLSMRYDM